ncbi:MAG TPA: response regulator transcription factor [Gemmatimonadales bacterium]|nr:response regulator transcription factor [Gemmatimonadales bacterium]
MAALRVLLAYHEDLIRSALRVLLQGFPGIQVVAEASDGVSAIRMAVKTRPDVVLMNLQMPHLNGLNAAAELAKESSGARVLLLAESTDEPVIIRALRVGARGYLLKGAQPEELALAIQVVGRGETYLSPALAKKVLVDYPGRGEPRGDADRLSLRQREIVQLIAEGYTSKEIARLLTLSVRTVDRHRAILMGRLDLHSVANLVRWALRSGLAAS